MAGVAIFYFPCKAELWCFEILLNRNFLSIVFLELLNRFSWVHLDIIVKEIVEVLRVALWPAKVPNHLHYKMCLALISLLFFIVWFLLDFYLKKVPNHLHDKMFLTIQKWMSVVWVIFEGFLREENMKKNV